MIISGSAKIEKQDFMLFKYLKFSIVTLIDKSILILGLNSRQDEVQESIETVT